MGRKERIKEENLKKWIYVFGIILVFCIFSFFTCFYLYNRNLEKRASESLTEFATIEEIIPAEEIIQTSQSEDKTIDTVVLNEISKNTNIIENKNLNIKSSTLNETENKNVTNNQEVVSKEEVKEESIKESSKNNDNNENVESLVNQDTEANLSVETTEIKEEQTEEVLTQNENQNLEFASPVSGEIIKDYAEDTLVYSATLDEWGTHLGIDIKANKTTVVKASEAGVIEKINTDPRYGNSITINHGNGFKTVYSSLLVSDFFKLGEEVEKGDTIGTVGDTASFEIADDAHLHFEMYKDGIAVNPTLYLK